MARTTDPAMKHFLAAHAVSDREAVRRDVEPYIGMSMEERGRHITAACELAAAILEDHPDRDEILTRREEPHHAWYDLVAAFRDANG